MSAPLDPAERTLDPEGLRRHLVAPARAVVVSDVGGATSGGPGRRRNEDAWGFRGGSAFVVADGMGGRPGGDVASRRAVETLLTEFDDDGDDWSAAVRSANDSVRQAADAAGFERTGCVAVALTCRSGRITIVNIGDARAYRVRLGRPQQLTRDHSVAEHFAELGVRRADSGLRRRDLDAVTAYLGDATGWHDFSVHRPSVRPRDRIVLCTDGVHRMLSRHAWAVAVAADRAGDAATALVDSAIGAGGRDDATALVIDFADAETP